MAEENQGQEKTEEPTPRKREKAREEGQVASSRELSSMILLVVGATSLLVLAEPMASTLLVVVRDSFAAAKPEPEMTAWLSLIASEVILAFAPFFLILTIAGSLASVAMGGIVFAPKALAFKGNRISPVQGLKRMFSVRSLAELGKAVLKFLLVAGVATTVLGAVAGDILQLSSLALAAAVPSGLSIVGWSLLGIASSLILIAAIDVPFQRAQFHKQLKMTRQEVKEELKDSEGKPEVRSRLRQLQQEIARRQMLKDVPDADVVITNPEHYSVALKYDDGAMAAPRLLAKGADRLAFKIREIAALHDIPTVASPPLARAIYHSTEVGSEVPEDLYVAVAQVLAYVYQLQRFRRGEGAAPHPLGGIVVPPEYDEP